MILLSEYLNGKVQSCKKPVTACDRCTSLGLLSSLEDTKSQDDSRATQGLEQELELEFRSASELEPVYNQDQGQDHGQDVQQGEDYDTGPFLIQEYLSLIHISEPTRRTPISYAVFFALRKSRLNIDPH